MRELELAAVLGAGTGFSVVGGGGACDRALGKALRCFLIAKDVFSVYLSLF